MESLILSGPNGEVALTRRSQEWYMGHSGAVGALPRADAARVDEFLQFLNNTKPLRMLGEITPAARAAYGLDKGCRSVTLESRSTAAAPGKVRILLGGEDVRGGGLYALCSLSPNMLLLVDAGFSRFFDAPAAFWRDARIFVFDEASVTGLSLADQQGVRWELTRADGTFRFAEPETLAGMDASSSDVRLFLHNLLSLRALVGASAKQRAGDTPYMTVRVLAGGAPQQVEIYRARGDQESLIAASSWQSGFFRLDARQMELLDRRAFDLQGRGVVTIDTTALAALRISSGEQTLTADRRTDGWVDRQNGKSLLGIDMLLWRFNELRFVAEPSASLPGSARWVMTCELVGLDGKTAVGLTFYTDPQLPEGQCWLKVGQEAPYYPVSSQLLRDLKGQLPPKNGDA